MKVQKKYNLGGKNMAIKLPKSVQWCHFFRFLTICGVQIYIIGAIFCKKVIIWSIFTSLSYFFHNLKMTTHGHQGTFKIFFWKNALNIFLGKFNENGDNLDAYKHGTYQKP